MVEGKLTKYAKPMLGATYKELSKGIKKLADEAYVAKKGWSSEKVAAMVKEMTKQRNFAKMSSVMQDIIDYIS